MAIGMTILQCRRSLAFVMLSSAERSIPARSAFRPPRTLLVGPLCAAARRLRREMLRALSMTDTGSADADGHAHKEDAAAGDGACVHLDGNRIGGRRRW